MAPFRQGLTARYDGERRAVLLAWDPPPGGVSSWVFRSQAPVREIPIRAGRPVPPAGCELLSDLPGDASRGVDEATVAAETYWYQVLVDLGGGVAPEFSEVRITLPPPLGRVVVTRMKSRPGRILLEWTSGDDRVRGYRVYRSAAPGWTGVDRSSQVHEGPETRFEDRLRPADDLRPAEGSSGPGPRAGDSCWYHVVAVGEAKVAGETVRLVSDAVEVGPLVAVDEVRRAQGHGGDGRISLRWVSPPGVRRYVVVREEGGVPTSLEAGTPVVGATAGGVVDTGVTVGPRYHYRVGCVFEDANGEEVTTPGVTVGPCSAVRAASIPRPEGSIRDGRIHVTWDTRSQDAGDAVPPVSVHRLDRNPFGEWDAVVPLADLMSLAEPVAADAGGFSAPRDPDRPWFVLVSPLDATSVYVHWMVYVTSVDIDVKRDPDGQTLSLEWEWPFGLEGGRLVRELRAGHLDGWLGTEEIPIEGVVGSRRGSWSDGIPTDRPVRTIEYRVVPEAPAESALPVVVIDDPESGRRVYVGDRAFLRYRIYLGADGFLGWLLGRRCWWVEFLLDRSVDVPPTVQVVVWRQRDAQWEEEVAAEWPGKRAPREGKWVRVRVSDPTPSFPRLRLEDPSREGELDLVLETRDGPNQG